MKERRALEKKLKEIEQDQIVNGIASNGTTTGNGNGSLNQYYDSVNHNHINNKKNIEYTESYSYGNGTANGATELVNRKK